MIRNYLESCEEFLMESNDECAMKRVPKVMGRPTASRECIPGPKNGTWGTHFLGIANKSVDEIDLRRDGDDAPLVA
jgi:hypothetical protein